MADQDLATGTINLNSKTNYKSSGPSNIFSIKNPPPGTNEPILASTTPRISAKISSICYAWDVMQTCSGPQIQLMAQGKGIFQNFILVGYQNGNGTAVYFNGTTSTGAGSTAATAAAGAGTRIGVSNLGVWMVVVGVVAWFL